jgi:pimeloyl-ACP methyl ester carboxylesterase
VAALSLESRSWGSGPQRALLIHGASSSGEVWWRLGPDLATLGYTVVAPDLRGHGASPRNGDWSLAAYCEDLIALGGGWDLVLGHSLGGLLAVVVQTGHPAFARRLVLEDPALRFAASPEFLAWLVDEFAAPMTADRLAAENPSWHANDVATKVRALQAVGPEAIRATFEAIGDTDEWATLAELEIPTLLVAGDPANGAMVGEIDLAAAAAIPGVRCIAIEGASHSIHRDSYPRFWDAVRSFLAT